MKIVIQDDMKDNNKIGWHWLSNDKRLKYGDGRTVAVGERLPFFKRTPDSIPIICRTGMHASPTPSAGIEYAPGEVLCRVFVYDVVDDRPGDKFVGAERTVIEMHNVRKILHKLRLPLMEIYMKSFRNVGLCMTNAYKYAKKNPNKQDRNKIRRNSTLWMETLGYCGSAVNIKMIRFLLESVPLRPREEMKNLIDKELRSIFIV